MIKTFEYSRSLFLDPFPTLENRTIKFIPHSSNQTLGWVSNIESFKNDQLIIYSNARNRGAGLFYYSPETFISSKIQGLEGRIWDFCLSSGKQVVTIGDENLVTACIFQVEQEIPIIQTTVDLIKGDSSSRYEQVRFVPKNEEYYAIRSEKEFQYRNIDRKESSILKNIKLVDDQHTGWMEWNSLDGNLLAGLVVGGQGLRIYDVRSKGNEIAYSRSFNQAMTIDGHSRVHWSPFIPYWVAISTGFGIQIHDLRYLTHEPQSILKVDHVNDFSWSNTNTELIFASSSDRYSSLWSLFDCKNPKLLVRQKDCGGDIIKILPSKSQMNMFYGTSLLGRIFRMEIDKESLVTCVPFQKFKGEEEREIESSFYCRDFESVYKKLIDYADSSSYKNFQNLKYLADRTLPSIAISPKAWSFEHISTDKQEFVNDLTKYSVALPPGFDLDKFESKNTILKDAIDYVRLKLKIMEIIQDGETEFLLTHLDKVLWALQRNPKFLSADVISLLISMVLAKERLSGLHLGRKIIFNSILSWDEVSTIIHTLIFPTIFDKESANLFMEASKESKEDGTNSDNMTLPPPSVASNKAGKIGDKDKSLYTPSRQVLNEIRNFIPSLDMALLMIDLEIEIEETTPKDRSKVIQEAILKNEKSSISAKTQLLLYEGLLEENRLDAYFKQIKNIISLKSEFSTALMSHVERNIFPKVKYVLAQAVDTQRPSLVIKAIQLVILIADAIRPLPVAIEPFLLDRFKKLVRIMVGEDYFNVSGYQQFSSLLHSIVIPFSDDHGIWKEISRLQLLLIN